MQRLITLLVFGVAIAIFAGGVWSVGYRTALSAVAEQGRVYLLSASERLLEQLARYRQLADVLSDHPEIIAIAEQTLPAENATKLLLKTGDSTGALEVAFVDKSGTLTASSNPDSIGTSISAAPHFDRAMTGALGVHHFFDEAGTRIFAYLAPVRVNTQPAGAVLVRVSMENVEESDWRSAAQVVFFTDEAEIVFVSNRSELLNQSFSPAPKQAAVSPSEVRGISDMTEWRLNGERYLPQRALYLRVNKPVIGMTGHSLISTAPALRIALLQSLVAAAVCLTFGAFLFLTMERRRTLAQANLMLEQRVAARTEQLTEANVSLRHEIAERREAEVALRKAQSDLVQAGKLSALGQMSAGISHELNQPLMAIRSFAENGRAFLDREEPQEAAKNLSRIGDLSRRMARIIKNLRAFARQEHEPVTDVDLHAVIEAVLELAMPQLTQDNVEVQRPETYGSLWVRGGEVRLQQVLMNLVSNAADAMAESDEKTLIIAIHKEAGKVLLSVADTGPGLDEPDKIFDPFYSTKEVGQSEGMGLGLSISYGLVQSFGGAISGMNRETGGAIFTVELRASKEA